MVVLTNLSCHGFEEAIRGLRNPLNSWGQSDSYFGEEFEDIGENDYKLMKNEAKAGTSNAKYRRYITVYVDIYAPLYWWKEFDTYRVGVAPNPTDIEMNSCSTMHTIHKRPLNIGEFTRGSLDDKGLQNLQNTIDYINEQRELYLETKDKLYWRRMIESLPSSYMQLRTVKLNYEVLYSMYKDRHNHKLIEWRDVCKYFKDHLPVSELFTMEFGE